jgi:hypothetical protein
MEFDQAMVDDIQSQMFINLDPPDNISVYLPQPVHTAICQTSLL